MNREHLLIFKAWFDRHCESFSTHDEQDQKNYLVKREHTARVSSVISRIAKDIGLDEEKCLLAEAIGLFHDVGRFPQYQQYKTFQDSISVNHAALGVKVLLKSGILDSLPSGEKSLIIRSVTLHNRLEIPQDIDQETLLFVRIIRDADKIDIWRVFLDYFNQPVQDRAGAVGLGLPDIPSYSPEILVNLERRQLVLLESLKTLTDFKLLQLAWIYDINFPASLRIIVERNYLDRFAELLPQAAEIKRAVGAVSDYVREKLENQ